MGVRLNATSNSDPNQKILYHRCHILFFFSSKTANRFKPKDDEFASKIGPPVKSRQTILNESFVAAVKNNQAEVVGMILEQTINSREAGLTGTGGGGEFDGSIEANIEKR